MHTAETTPIGTEKPVRLLIVEDDPGDARLVRLALAESGHPCEVEVAERVSTALERLNDSVFDLVLLDMGLPDSQGIDTVSKVHAECPNIPIVVLTGLDDENIGAHAVRIGAQEYLVKEDISSNLLKRAISYAIERKQAEEERLEREKLQSILEIAGAVCHELNQPMQAISGYSEMLMADISKDNPLYEDFKEIKRQIVRMANITKKLMRITRYETRDYIGGRRIIDIDKAIEVSKVPKVS